MRLRPTIATAAAILSLACTGCATTGAYAEYDSGYDGYHDGGTVSADISFFYDDLAPYGTWFRMPGYGWCWSPYDVAVGWRPYTNGYWAYSDWGWTWASYEPWGWATFHYGRWAYDDFYGWIWVPDDVWGPAWVAWRESPGWIGWAPLPPEVRWSASVQLTASSYDYDRYIDPYDWCFVRDADFTTHRLRDRVVPASRNVTLIGRTRNVTHYVDVRSRPFDRGVDLESLEHRLHRTIPRYRIESTDRAPRGHGTERSGRTLRMYRPDVRHAPSDRSIHRTPVTRPPVSRSEFDRRLQQDRRALDRRIANQRARLRREHEQELRQRGADRAELRRRHEEEARAQRKLEERERQALEHRKERMERWMEQRGNDRSDRRGGNDRNDREQRGRGRSQDHGRH